MPSMAMYHRVPYILVLFSSTNVIVVLLSLLAGLALLSDDLATVSCSRTHLRCQRFVVSHLLLFYEIFPALREIFDFVVFSEQASAFALS